MAMYGGIDLHSNNLVLVLVDGDGQQVRVRKLPTDLSAVLEELRPFGEDVQALAVESTYNWYWLVDGLHDAGYRVALANTRAIQQYDGLKFTDDRHDARWLAELLRLGVLPKGYIYPREERAVRDLLRHRMRLVQERAGHILSIQNLVTRNTGQRLSGNRIKTLTETDVEALLPEGNRALPVQTNLALMRSLDQQIAAIEASIRRQVRPRPEYKLLQSVAGVGEILGQTILLETGTIERFPGPGQYASYCRCVRSERQSNGKKKGTNNRKNGNRYLAWAFTEAAGFAIRYDTMVKRYYQRKQAKRCQPVAFKAVAHKLARATYHVLRTEEPFETERAFGS